MLTPIYTKPNVNLNIDNQIISKTFGYIFDHIQTPIADIAFYQVECTIEDQVISDNQLGMDTK